MNDFARYCFLPGLLALICLPLTGQATEPNLTLVLHASQFSPSPLVIPSNSKIRLVVDNQETEAMELESKSLSLEIVIPPQHATAIHLGPLAPGRYEFFNDNNPQERGVIIAQPSR